MGKSCRGKRGLVAFTGSIFSVACSLFLLVVGADSALAQLPTLTINNASSNEGNSGVTNLVMTVTLSAASAGTVTVNYATSNGTAIAGDDYTAGAGTLTFSPGQTSKTLAVVLKGEMLVESNETIIVTLSGAVGATIADGQATATILNDDSTALNISDVNVNEGNAGGTNMVFTVTLSNPSVFTVMVNFTTTDGSAIAGSDYEAMSGTLTFTPGLQSKTITVAITGDTLVEPNESLTVTLSGASNATIADGQGLGTITNDDTASMTINDTSTAEGNAGTASLVFTVTLSNPHASPVTANYATSNGTATAGVDYTTASGIVTIAAGTLSQTISVSVLGDLTVEPNETLTVTLSGASGGTMIADAQGVGIITNDDSTALSIADASVLEGGVGETAAMAFTVTLSNPSASTVTVNYATSNGTAIAGTDYTAAGSAVTFPPGSQSQTLTVAVLGDALVEPNETLTVTLSGASGGTAISDAQGIGTILNDDTTALTIADASVAEGNIGTTNMVFALSLSNPSATTVTVSYASADGSAVAGMDYTAATGTVTFVPGQTNQTLTVAVTTEMLVELDETLTVTLSGPVGATIADGQGLGTITNDDTTALSITNSSIPEGNTGTTALVFTVTLSNPSASSVTVGYDTVNDTALSGMDYTATSGTLTFTPGQTSQTLSVAVTGDTTVESDETFSVTLGNANGATIADGAGLGTILNDDTTVLSISDASIVEGNTGTIGLLFIVTLTNPSATTVTVGYGTSNGSADAGADYTAVNGTVTFTPGQTSQTLSVAVTGDTIVESDETFSVTLSGAVEATIEDGLGVGTIVNDDSTAQTIADASIGEGDTGTTDLMFTVTLSNPSATTVTVNYATTNSSAVAGTDYAAAGGTLTFQEGQTSQTITVVVTGETLVESDETFTVALIEPVGASLADGLGVGTITNDDSTAVSIADTNIAEGNSGTTDIVFTVTLSNPSATTVTVNYDTSNGTAIAGSDYAATSGLVTFAAEQTSQTFTVPITGEKQVEPDETFAVTLTNPVGATIASGLGLGTIIDDDTTALRISDVSAVEGAPATTKNFVFTVALSNPSASPVTVRYATANGTAVASSDYTAVPATTLTFTPGQTSKTVPVVVKGDAVAEANETFFVNLSNAVGAPIADAQGRGTIVNDDTARISINDVTSTEGAPGTMKNFVFTVRLSNPSATPVTVRYATVNGSAVAPSDYTAVPATTLTFTPGQTSKTVPVVVKGDNVVEINETFTVALSNAVGGTIADGVGLGTITNDDTTVLRINNVSMTEGNSGTKNFAFTVRLSNPSSRAVTVRYATANGTATAGSDYNALAATTLTFPAGQTTRPITVVVRGDVVVEPAETFFVRLSAPVGATIADNEGLGTITNDDATALSINDVSATEGNTGTKNFTFTVRLSNPSSRAVTVRYATANGTARAGSDYNTLIATTLSFAALQTTRPITVVVRGDQVVEPNETFFVRLSSPVGATISDGSGQGTITNDDGSSLSIADVSRREGNNGITPFCFPVTLSQASETPVTVGYTTVAGNTVASSEAAEAGRDFTEASGTIQFGPGQTRQTICVRVTADREVETNEVFGVVLSGSEDVIIADGYGAGKILNDDGPILDIADVRRAEGNSGTRLFTFPVTLEPASTSEVTVNYVTMDGTAVAGSAYTETSGTLKFVAGERRKMIRVEVYGDTIVEPNETFLVHLSSVVGATLARDEAVGTILNDDESVLLIADVRQAEGNSGTRDFAFRVKLRPASTHEVSVNYVIEEDSATADSDYTATNGTLTFAPGQTRQTIHVGVRGDTAVEPNETFRVRLSDAVGATIFDDEGLGTIVNNDGSRLRINNVRRLEGNTSTHNFVFRVTLHPASTSEVTVDYATADGSATAGSDYVATSGTLTFAPGQTSLPLPVAVIGDTIGEPNETFAVKLSNAVDATIREERGIGTIRQDDPEGLTTEEDEVSETDDMAQNQE